MLDVLDELEGGEPGVVLISVGNDGRTSTGCSSSVQFLFSVGYIYIVYIYIYIY